MGSNVYLLISKAQVQKSIAQSSASQLNIWKNRLLINLYLFDLEIQMIDLKAYKSRISIVPHSVYAQVAFPSPSNPFHFLANRMYSTEILTEINLNCETKLEVIPVSVHCQPFAPVSEILCGPASTQNNWNSYNTLVESSFWKCRSLKQSRV
jgi:hypothetical protein